MAPSQPVRTPAFPPRSNRLVRSPILKPTRERRERGTSEERVKPQFHQNEFADKLRAAGKDVYNRSTAAGKDVDNVTVK